VRLACAIGPERLHSPRTTARTVISKILYLRELPEQRRMMHALS